VTPLDFSSHLGGFGGLTPETPGPSLLLIFQVPLGGFGGLTPETPGLLIPVRVFLKNKRYRLFYT
jgi:hypothetical protein